MTTDHRGHTLAVRLWEANQDLAQASRKTPFVQGLADGSLRRSSFQAYVAQDAYFLQSFARAYALALAHCPDNEGLHDFADLLQGVLEELKLHRSYAVCWGVDLHAVNPAPATQAYTEFLFAVASRGSTGEVCAAMTPCMRLYAWLGQELARETGPVVHEYSEWIRTYSAAEFEHLARHLESLLDRYAEDTAANRSLYRQAMLLEEQFFAAHGKKD